MHETAYALMERELNALPPAPRRVLDVGSYDVNGSLRPLVEGRGWEYVGLDVRSGSNVDIVSPDPYRFPLGYETFDVVVTVSALNFCARPWQLLPEMARVLKPGGVLIAHAVWNWDYHERDYGDYWRILPDGLLELFSLCPSLTDCRAAIENEHDVLGVAQKKVYS